MEFTPYSLVGSVVDKGHWFPNDPIMERKLHYVQEQSPLSPPHVTVEQPETDVSQPELDGHLPVLS